MEEKFSIKQTLMMVRDMLKNIGVVPIEYAEQIGVPVSRAIIILNDCVNAIRSETNTDPETEKEDADGNVDAE